MLEYPGILFLANELTASELQLYSSTLGASWTNGETELSGFRVSVERAASSQKEVLVESIVSFLSLPSMQLTDAGSCHI